MSSPSRTMRPLSGMVNPAMVISRVVLPDPLAPRSVRNSSRPTSMETSSTARTSP